MRLVIISNMAHYRRDDGVIVGHGATARELDALAALFDEVRHVACLHDESPPSSARPYTARNLELVAVPPAGGSQLRDKLQILELAPLYLRTIRRELKAADAVHIRGPANISLFALAVLAATRRPERRWVKYAGNWGPRESEPPFYKLQRRWLERGIPGVQVTVNGTWRDQPPHVHSFVNPCLTELEIAAGKRYASTKALSHPVRLIFVGHLGAAKNPAVAIETVAELRRRAVPAILDIVGEGRELSELTELARSMGVERDVTFHGALSREALEPLYGAAHFVVLPSRTEGWPKVLAEGMAFGAIPIASAVGSVPEVLDRIGAGHALSQVTAAAFAQCIEAYVREPAAWKLEVERALAHVGEFSYASYQSAVRELLRI